ncbi:MAG TPA: DUF1302 family protein [Desulfotignum sp.]|nr:DUF1302 family protein [Desulfotignum sp.]
MKVFSTGFIFLTASFLIFSPLVLISAGPSPLLAGEPPEEQQDTAPDAGSKQQLFDTGSLPEDLFEPSRDTQSAPPDFTFSGTVQVRGTMDTSSDDRQENNTSLRNRIILESRYKTSARVSVLSDYLYFGDDNQTDDYDLELHEAAFLYANNRLDLSVGRQIIRWGKADQFSPVDTLNPQDFREFMIPDYEETKQPVWMANLKLLFDGFALEGVFIPFFEAADIDYFDSDWAVFPHLKNRLEKAAVPDTLKNYINTLQVNETDPSNETEFALRLTTTVKNWDIGASWHHTTEDLPYFTSFPVKNIRVDGSFSEQSIASGLQNAVFTNENIEVAYQRTDVLGMEFETTLSGFGIRGEAAWYEKESFLTSSLTSTANHTFSTIIGADYTTPSQIYFNLQFLHRHIFDHTPDILYFEKDTYSLLGEISRDLFSPWIEGRLNYSVILNDNAWYLSPSIKHTRIPNLDIVIGANLFYGDDDTWLGRFNNDSQFFVDVSYHF